MQVRTTETGRLIALGSFQARKTSLAIAKKLEEGILRLKELCSHMEITAETL